MDIIENKYFYLDLKNQQPVKYFIKKCLYPFVCLKYKLILSKAPETNEKKYKVTACAIFKNEGKYLKEWLEYNKIIGIEHLYMYNNFSDDNYTEILKPYIESDYVTLIDWPVQQGQIPAYKDCIEKYKKETQWLGFIDIDEFIVPKKHNNIYDFLKTFSKYPSVLLYWKVFCSGGLVERDPNTLVSESFYSCWDKYDAVGKCFYNTAFDVDFDFEKNTSLHHRFWGKKDNLNIAPVNCFKKFSVFDFNYGKNEDFPIQINHYFTKSFNEYVEKTSKGDVFFKENPHNLDYYYAHEARCKSTDHSIDKYLTKLKIAMEK